MLLDRIKRLFRKSSGGRKKPQREERGNVNVPQKVNRRRPIWELAYNKLDEDLREKYVALLGEEWQKQERTDADTNQQTRYNALIESGLKKLDEENTLQQGLATTSKFIETARNFVDQAVKVSPEASLIWAGVCIVLPLVTNLQAAKDAVRGGFGFATQRIRYYIVSDKHMLPDESTGQNQELGRADWTDLDEKLYDSLLALFQKLLAFQIMTVLKLYHRNPIQDIFQLVDWAEMQRDIEKLETDFQRDWDQVDSVIRRRTEANIHKALGETKFVLEKSLGVQKEHLDLAKKALLHELSSDEDDCRKVFRIVGEGREDYYESYKLQVAERVDGTCAWFLDNASYRSWLKDPNGPLVVSADPGFGKTVLAKYLIDSRLQGLRSEAVICYFFFSAQAQNTVPQLLCALIHQITIQQPVAIRHAIQPWQHNGKKLTSMTTTLWVILSAMIGDPAVQQVILILDALDQCETPDFIQRLLGLWRINQEHKKFTFLAMTRPCNGVMSEFHQLFQVKPEAHISAAECFQDLAKEVNLVIEHHATELEAKGLLDESTKVHLVKRLQEFDAQRIYLLTHAIFQLIKRENFENTEDAIDKIINALPHSVQEAYEKALNASEDEHKPWIRKAFCIILAANRPLTLQEMHIAMELGADSPKPPERYRNLELILRNRCGFLLTISQDRIYLFNQTVRDFLMQPESSRDDGRGAPISDIECQRVLAWSCVSYFDLVLKPSIASFSNGVRGSSMSKAGQENAEFLQYVANNWFRHVQAARLELDPELAKKFEAFCNPQNQLCRIWTETYKPEVGKPLVNFRDVNTLWMASFTGLTALVQQILEAGVVSDTRNEDGHNTVLIAALQDNPGVLDLLLKSRHVRTDLRDMWRRGALQAAVDSRNPAAVEVLLRSGKVDVCTLNSHGQTPFSSAMLRNDAEIIQAFLDSGASSNDAFNAKDAFGKTPLIIACEIQKFDLFQDLIGTGCCDVNSQDCNRQTTLGYSTLFGYENFARALLQIEATDANIADKNGETPFTWATKLGRGGIVQQMIDLGKVCINATDKYGRTALHQAVRTAHPHIVQILLQNSAEANTSDLQGWTPLMDAADLGNKDIVKQLLETKKVTVNGTNENGTTALFKATNHRHKAVVQLLLEFSADPNISDIEGCTPLMIAALNGDMEIASLLLESSGTNVNLTDAEGRDAMWYADLRNHTAIMQLLSTPRIDTKGKSTVDDQ